MFLSTNQWWAYDFPDGGGNLIGGDANFVWPILPEIIYGNGKLFPWTSTASRVIPIFSDTNSSKLYFKVYSYLPSKPPPKFDGDLKGNCRSPPLSTTSASSVSHVFLSNTLFPFLGLNIKGRCKLPARRKPQSSHGIHTNFHFTSASMSIVHEKKFMKTYIEALSQLQFVCHSKSQVCCRL